MKSNFKFNLITKLFLCSVLILSILMLIFIVILPSYASDTNDSSSSVEHNDIIVEDSSSYNYKDSETSSECSEQEFSSDSNSKNVNSRVKLNTGNTTGAISNSESSTTADSEPELEETHSNIESSCSSNFESSNFEESSSNVEYKNKYPAAEKIWSIMKSYGWSDQVCAGIMGNLMAEVGGQTLNLDWKSNTGSEIGICQWMGSRKSELIKKYGSRPSCEEQVQFMYDELKGSNGVTRQVSSSQYNSIISSSTPEDAALKFAKYFERCSTSTYSIRKCNAKTAYNYFCQ